MRENYCCNVIEDAASGAVLIVKVFTPPPHFSRTEFGISDDGNFVVSEELSFLENFIGVRSFVQKHL
jgi:hypothetical protein